MHACLTDDLTSIYVHNRNLNVVPDSDMNSVYSVIYSTPNHRSQL